MSTSLRTIKSTEEAIRTIDTPQRRDKLMKVA